jgi:hypothetical protein
MSGQCVTIVFVSSQAYVGGALGGLAGADKMCQSLAQGAGLPGSFIAWLSDSQTNPASRLPHLGTPYVLPDGVQVASNWGQLTSGNLSHAIDQTEKKGQPPTGGLSIHAVWTDTTRYGTTYQSGVCGDWQDTSAAVKAFFVGDWTQSGPPWTLDDNNSMTGYACQLTAPIYCFGR